MKKIMVICLLFILMSTRISASILGMSVQDDKLVHLTTAGWITAVCNKYEMEWWQSGLVVLSMSMLKEMTDAQHTGMDSEDVNWAMAGWALAFPVEYSLDFLLK